MTAKMTASSSKRAINGIFLLDKPQGITSNCALQQVKRLFNAKKAGHTGSLDPLATGMLPICFGEATKFSQFLLDADKAYQATGLLGVKTTTADAMGDVISQVDDFCVSQQSLETALSHFTGNIKQVPSMFSALKHQGKPLYKLARAGIEIERKAREIIIYNLRLEGFDGVSFDLNVLCSKGTYIRNLVEDIGNELGLGAHVTRLHRQYTAGFDMEPMYSLQALTDMSPDERLQCLLPEERAVHGYPIIILKPEQIQKMHYGQTVMLDADESSECSGLVRLRDINNVFIGLGDLNVTGELKVKRLVVMDPA